VLSLMESGGVAFLFLAVRHAPMDPIPDPSFAGATDPRRRTLDPPRQGRHAHHGWRPSSSWRRSSVYAMGHVGTSIVFTRSGFLVLAVIVASGFLGFLDDYIGIRNARNLGLNKRGKLAGQLLIAAVFAVLSIDLGPHLDQPVLHPFLIARLESDVGRVVRARDAGDHRGVQNAVNLTDGLDGLAAGSGTFCFGVLAIIGYWQFPSLLDLPTCTPHSISVSSTVGLVGACLGFLWWNAAPARIIMGDTGGLGDRHRTRCVVSS